ncbi:MAG: glycosyltransferase family A protein [Pseudomonadota bacterium]
MTPPAVAVVIPVYDRAATVGRAIDSALAQTMADLEVVVVDDASTDDTAARVLAHPDSRVRLVRHEQNRGAAGARNTGVAAATSPWIAFLDSDDAWDGPKLARQLERVGQGPEPSCITGYRLVRAASGQVVERRAEGLGDITGRLLDVCDLSPGATLLVRRDVLLAIGGYPEDLRRFEDWDVLFRLAEHGIVAVPECLASVHETDYPAPAAVAEAARVLLDRRGRWIEERLGPRARRRFRSTLHIERAYASLRRRHYAAATLQACSAAVVSPARAWTAARRLTSKLAARDY